MSKSNALWRLFLFPKDITRTHQDCGVCMGLGLAKRHLLDSPCKDPLHSLHRHLSMAIVTPRPHKVDNNLTTSFELKSSVVLPHMRR